MLIQELRNKPIRPYLCHKETRMDIIDQISQTLLDLTLEKNLRFHDFDEIPYYLRMLKINLDKSKLEERFQTESMRDKMIYNLYVAGYHKKCHHHWRPIDIRRVGLDKGAFKGFNTGGMLWGERGCGKSQILAYLTAWAHENSWINVTVTGCTDFVDASQRIERFENGLYIQPNLASRLLNDMKI
mmetsp:Transcript_8449/g.14169  ORF Transcript_8449/g.14169 Transcript_8449/m.14169 type:complete len:185 (-) Transcript_8449:892-1446(-)